MSAQRDTECVARPREGNSITPDLHPDHLDPEFIQRFSEDYLSLPHYSRMSFIFNAYSIEFSLRKNYVSEHNLAFW